MATKTSARPAPKKLGKATQPTRRRRPSGKKLRTGEHLTKKRPVTENPFTWVAWTWHSYHNAWKRYRVVKHWWNERREEYQAWSHDKGERMHNNKVRRHNRRQEFKYRWRGYHECVGCETDAQGNPVSTWHRPHDIARHMDEKHGTAPPAPKSPQRPTSPPRRSSPQRPLNPSKAGASTTAGGMATLGAAMAAAAGNRKTSGPVSPPKQPRPATSPSNKGSGQPGSTKPIPNPAASGNQNGQNGGNQQSSGSVTAGPWKYANIGPNTPKSTAWRRGMAQLDGVVEAVSAWASAPAETWEQEKAETEASAEVFRQVADLIRHRAEVMVEQLKLDPATVEPYDDAANLISGVGDHLMEVANRIEARYQPHREDIERGHFGKETAEFFGQGG